MTTVTQTGTTVELAIEHALEKMNVSRDEVVIEVIEQGRKGFLGIGAKDAEVKVTVKEQLIPTEKAEKEVPQEIKAAAKEVIKTPKQEVETETPIPSEDEQQKNPIVETTNYLKEVAKEMNIDDLEISHEVDGKYVHFQLESAKAALLIGKRGQNLNALQQLSQLVANKYSSQFQVIRLNVGDYRERREQSLAQLANRMADKAIKIKRKVQLEPMPAYERKVIHHTLSNRMDVETYSEGSDPHRYLVIEPIQ